ncbi:AAA family ATPase [Paenibacillus sp. FJAT-26967]|uniref:AAA family ATPase n=1 Tax=Paenibacillus sp. FJAT-26967 TaxID=1729690 RepID=UPI000838755C|nr:AAA family ATPase [Paenibacillus sp. FJAT-26967]
MTAPKISIVCDDNRLTQQLAQNIHFHNMAVGELIDKPREAALQIDPREPRVILLVESEDNPHVAQTIQQIRKVNSTAPVIFLSKQADFSTLREIYRCGVTDVIRVPEELDQLDKVLERAMQTLKQNRHKSELSKTSAAELSGTVISVYSGKGGSGTSFLAANLANAIAANSEMRTLLIDLNLQFGSIQHLFNLKHDRNIGDLKSVLQELTFSQLNNVISRTEASPLSILLSPNHPQEAEMFHSEDIELLLSACRQHFDCIILDVPKELNEISISALSQSDKILYVVNLERPSIVRMKDVLNILDRYHLLKEDIVALVVNKFSKKQDISLDDLGKMSSLPVISKISDDFKGLQSHFNLGEPLSFQLKDKKLKGPVRDLAGLTSDLLVAMGGDKNVHLPKAQ